MLGSHLSVAVPAVTRLAAKAEHVRTCAGVAHAAACANISKHAVYIYVLCPARTTCTKVRVNRYRWTLRREAHGALTRACVRQPIRLLRKNARPSYQERQANDGPTDGRTLNVSQII